MIKQVILLVSAFLVFQSTYAQSWVQRTNFGGTGRHRGVGMSIGNKGYIGLGHVNGAQINVIYDDWWEYDPSSDSWTQKSNFPYSPGTYGAAAFSTATRGYVGGGATLSNQFYEYNPQTNTWVAIANCPGVPDDQACFSVNNKGYVIVGNLLWEYDPSGGTWSAKQTAPVTFGAWCSAFAIASSGFVKSGTLLYEYKPALDQWLQRASFPGIASNGSLAFIQNSKGYILTGFSGSLANVTDEVWEYNPGNNVWTQKFSTLGTSRRFSVGFTINNRAYYGTGTNGINFNDFWEMVDNVSTNDLTGLNIDVQAYPIPATDQVNFSISGSSNFIHTSDCQILVYDLSGQLVARQAMTTNACTIYRQDLAAGIYIYQLNIGGIAAKQGKLIFN
ncbi:MAG: T9SS type A sorting domain-containing protein [Bacteroidia bacterium]